MPRRNDPEIKKYTLKNGKTKYMFKTYLGIDPETRKPKKVSRSGFDSWTEAQTAKTNLKAQGVTGVKNRQKEKTLQEVWNTWFDIYKQDKRGSTIVGTKASWDNHIKPEFGDSYVNHISSEHIQRFVIDESNKFSAYRVSINLLHRLILYAIKHGWCKSNPFLKVDIPKRSNVKSNRVHRNFLTETEFHKFLDRSKKVDYKQYTFIIILASLGIRNGEALALKWKNFDFKNNTVSISNSISKDADNVKHYGATKTPSGVRILPMSDNLKNVLLEWKSKTLYSKDDDFVIPSISGSFLSSQSTDKWFSRFFKENPDLHKITPHGLRHTLATLLLNNDGANPKDVQYLLGHSSAKLTLDTYGHITDQNRINVSKSIKNLGL